MSQLSKHTDLQVIVADIQLKLIEFFPDISHRRKELIKAMVEAAWAAGRVNAFNEAAGGEDEHE